LWLLKSIYLSNAFLSLLYGSDLQNTSEAVLFPSILLFIFLPAHNLLFSSTEPGHVSPPVLLVSAPPHSAATGARGAALSSELLIREIADN
jgi:hypothetical protein